MSVRRCEFCGRRLQNIGGKRYATRSGRRFCDRACSHVSWRMKRGDEPSLLCRRLLARIAELEAESRHALVIQLGPNHQPVTSVRVMFDTDADPVSPEHAPRVLARRDLARRLAGV